MPPTCESAAERWWHGYDTPSRALLPKWLQHLHRNLADSRGRRSEVRLAALQIERACGPRPGDVPAPVHAPKNWGIKRHKALRKHESSLLTQIRTGCIGLDEFLHERGVPSRATPLCRCGNGPETPEHILLFCTLLTTERQELQAALPVAARTRTDIEALTNKPDTAATLVRWFLRLQRLQEYRTAVRIFPPDAEDPRGTEDGQSTNGTREADEGATLLSNHEHRV